MYGRNGWDEDTCYIPKDVRRGTDRGYRGSNETKEKFDKVEQREKDMKRDLLKIKKDLCKIYGISETMDDYLLNNLEGIPDDLNTVIELLVSQIKDTTEEHVFDVDRMPRITIDVSHNRLADFLNALPVEQVLSDASLSPNQQN